MQAFIAGYCEIVRPKVTELLSPNPADYILDIACGNGNYSSYLAQRGASIVAFDYSKKMIFLTFVLELDLSLMDFMKNVSKTTKKFLW